MPGIIAFQRHTVENCPMNNEKMKNMASEMMGNIGALLKKYGIKMVGNWTVAREHLTIIVYEASSIDAFIKLQMEPIIMKWLTQHTTEIKIAMYTEEAMKLLK